MLKNALQLRLYSFSRIALALVMLSAILVSGQPSLAKDKEKEAKPPKLKQTRELVAKPEISSTALQEILQLSWDPSGGAEIKKISLEKVFRETLAHSILIQQAQARIKDAEAQAKEIRNPLPFNFLDMPTVNRAADNHIQAAKAHYEAARQKELLQSARMHAALTETFLNKYLAFQMISQGKIYLKAEEQRFLAGETNRFDVIQTQMALMERYDRYLSADNAYHTASMSLARQIAANPDKNLLPEELSLQNEDATVPLLQMLPTDLTLGKIHHAIKTRPDLRELALRRVSLKDLLKNTVGADRQKKEAELRQLDFEIEKATSLAKMMADKAYAELKLLEHRLVLARQRFELSRELVRQLQISHEAGFSSSKEVLDGQIQWAKAQADLLNTQVATNLGQLQLLYEMGLLRDDIFAHPPTIPPHSL